MTHIETIGHELAGALKQNSADHIEARLEESQTSHITYRGRKLESIGRATATGGNVRALVRGGWGFISFNNLDELPGRVELAVKQAQLVGSEESKLAPLEPVVDIVPMDMDKNPVTMTLDKKKQLLDDYNDIIWRTPGIQTSTISYAETEWKSGWSVPADVHPTLMHDDFADVGHGLGTMRYKLTATTAAQTLATEGTECRESGAVCRRVHTVAYRKDNSYLGYLHELFNCPYIYGSKRIKGGHQSDVLVGSDCADFAVYGKRRQRGKKKFGYTYTGGLYKLAKRRWKVSLDDEQFYVDKKKRRLTFGDGETIRPGDLINFEGGHVGVLVKDDGDGYLDTGDLIMHTLFREPEIVSIDDCRWGQVNGKEVLRLKD